ncbi:hypothetical protein AABB24_038214, partial [Solanum stoloniferum]
MDVRRLKIPKPIAIFSHIKRPLTCVIYTASSDQISEPLQKAQSNKPNPTSEKKQKKGLDLNLRKWVVSVLSNPPVDSLKIKDLLTLLTPQQFDAIFLEIYSSLKPLNVLKFFHVASGTCGFSFSVRSYCTLLRLLVASNHDVPARLLLIRLVDGNLPALF